MASLSDLRSFLRVTSGGKTTLKTADGVKVSIKGTATTRDVKGVIALAASAEVKATMPVVEMDNAVEQGESYSPSGEAARLFVSALFGRDGQLKAELSAWDEEAARIAATVKAKAAAEEAARIAAEEGARAAADAKTKADKAAAAKAAKEAAKVAANGQS